MSAPRRVLVVSFFYPPDAAVGGRRVSKFVEYLPQFGWAATVLTALTVPGAPPPTDGEPPVYATRFVSPWKRGLRHRRSAGSAPAGAPPLRERLGRGAVTGRAYRALRHVLPMSSVRMPDATLGWVPFAVAEGQRLLKDGGFDAILSSAGPPSSHIVAARLQRYSGLPWIADYRDLWSENHWDTRVAAFQRVERWLERRVLRRARGLTTVSPTLVHRLGELHGKPVELIYNGFDPRDYPPSKRPGQTFVLTYVGSLYWPRQNPEPLFAALARLAARPDLVLDLDQVAFQVQFLGTPPGVVEPLAQRHRVARWVSRIEPVPHRESLARQMASTALLYLGWHDPAEGYLTAKIFEYLGARRPILAVGPKGGVVSELLRTCGIPDLTDDPEKIATTLEGWVREFARTGKVSVEQNDDAVSHYTRRAQTERLARLLDKVAAR